MKDKIGAVDRISFVMNGQPFVPGAQPVPTKSVNYCPHKPEPGGRCTLLVGLCGYPACNQPPKE
jgi:hypothetical protein